MPLVLAVIGLALLAVGLGIYPRRAEAPQPPSVTVYIGGNSSYVDKNINVLYTVHQVRPNLAKVTIQLALATST